MRDNEKKTQYRSRPGSGMMRLAAAAGAVIGILIILSIVFIVPRPEVQNNSTASKPPDPKQVFTRGHYNAILTLSDGRQIKLNHLLKGKTGKEGIIKIKEGLVDFYQAGKNTQQAHNKEQEILYNTLSTPNAGQYRLILPDGSKVWLNAASLIKFPSVFHGKTRNICVSGEVYAEIVQDKSKLFVIHILSDSGRERGTIITSEAHLNVEAYSGNPRVIATNFGGSITAGNSSEEKTSMPGEEIRWGKNVLQVRKALFPEAVKAWKDGEFNFEGDDIKRVMQQIARWYDVKIKYNNIPSARFNGSISRKSNLSDVLKMLEMTGAVHFRVEGKTVVVEK